VKQYRVFVRDKTTKKFDLWDGSYAITTTSDGGQDVSLWHGDYEGKFETYLNQKAFDEYDPVEFDDDPHIHSGAVLLCDLDLTKPIPKEVNCVIAYMVTAELCEGDYADVDGIVRIVRWDDAHKAVVLSDTDGELILWDETIFDGPPIEHLGHQLTHRIERGEAVER